MANKIEYDVSKQQPHDHYGYMATFGRASEVIVCPFCSTEVRAYVWSLAGSGKKCPTCGAIHTGFGITLPVKVNP